MLVVRVVLAHKPAAAVVQVGQHIGVEAVVHRPAAWAAAVHIVVEAVVHRPVAAVRVVQHIGAEAVVHRPAAAARVGQHIVVEPALAA